MRVLTLGANYEPIGTVSWKKAINLLYTNKIIILEEYDEELRSPSCKIKIPSVIVFKNNKHRKINSIRFSRNNVWLRDEGKCQYCGINVSAKNFTVDHVNPKCKGGKTSWENIVVCCYKCNQKKGEKTLKESGFKLSNLPKKPSSLPYISDINGFYNENSLHHTWKFWLGRQ